MQPMLPARHPISTMSTMRTTHASRDSRRYCAATGGEGG